MDTMTNCRACLSTNLFMFLPLGDHPPANGFLRADQLDKPEATFPLNTFVCLDCGLIEVPDNVPADFFRNYVYVPSGATTMFTHFEAFAEQMVRSFAPNADDLIIDIGCNNGLFLGYCKEKGGRVLGIDPADNLTELVVQKGIEVVREYFSTATGQAVAASHPPAKVITSSNTFNHIDNLHDFMGGIGHVLAPEGVFVVEVPHSLDLVQKNEFDTIYHEHVSEFSVKSFVDLYRFFDLEVFRIESLPIHGGSMRVFAQRCGASRPVEPMVKEWLAREVAAELFTKETYEAFTHRVHAIRTDLLKLLKKLQAEGKTIAGYGAPAKGNTLLNYYGIGPDTLPYLVDRNELKQGLYSPGMHIPVVGAEKILETQPDYLLVLAWNFADEIIEQQAEYRARGGQFILPIPTPTIVA